jgi:hypothetical protein
MQHKAVLASPAISISNIRRALRVQYFGSAVDAVPPTRMVNGGKLAVNAYVTEVVEFEAERIDGFAVAVVIEVVVVGADQAGAIYVATTPH